MWPQQCRAAHCLVSILCLSFTPVLAGMRMLPKATETLKLADSNARGLLQAAAGNATKQVAIAFAKTVDELDFAMENSATDIELQDHLDLRGLESDLEFDGSILPSIIEHMRSLRVCLALIHISSMHCMCVDEWLDSHIPLQ